MAIKSDVELQRALVLLTTAGEVSEGYIYIAFFSNFPVPNAQDLMSTRNEIARLTFTASNVNGLYTADYTIPLGGGFVCPFSTVATDAGNTATTFKVATYTQFKVNDRVQVGTETDRMVTAVNSGTHFITLDSALTAIPSNGTAVNVKISQRAIVRGGSGTANTGTIAIIEKYILYKSSAIGPLPGRMQGNIL